MCSWFIVEQAEDDVAVHLQGAASSALPYMHPFRLQYKLCGSSCYTAKPAALTADAMAWKVLAVMFGVRYLDSDSSPIPETPIHLAKTPLAQQGPQLHILNGLILPCCHPLLPLPTPVQGTVKALNKIMALKP